MGKVEHIALARSAQPQKATPHDVWATARIKAPDIGCVCA